MFARCLRSNIPPSFFSFNSVDKVWRVHHSKLSDLAGLAKHFYQVDLSNLSAHWQSLAEGGTVKKTKRKRVHAPNSSFKDLYVLDSAPKEVVRAAYEALLLMYHPDHNNGVGSPEKVQEVIAAYKRISKEK